MRRVERILWVTNLAPPYRVALWAQIERLRPLEVVTLAESEPNRSWSALDGQPFVIRLLGRPRVKIQGKGVVFYLYSRGLLRGIRKGTAVILPGWENPASWVLLLAARLVGAPHFAFVESTDATSGRGTRIFRRLKIAFHRSATGCIAVGKASAEGLNSLGVHPGRIVLCANSIDARALWSAASAHRAAAPEVGGHVFIFCGQLIHRKRPDLVVHAFAAARTKKDRLLVVGAGPEEASLRGLVAALGLEREVSFLGYVPDREMPSVWATGHTLILPSAAEVWGFVASEALAAGLDVVVSEHAGVFADIAGEVGVHGVCGDLASVTEAMAHSSAHWSGWLHRESQMARSPRASAEELVAGIDRVVGLTSAR